MALDRISLRRPYTSLVHAHAGRTQWPKLPPVTNTVRLDIQGGRIVPALSSFYGLTIYMYFLDNRQHHLAHIHVKYQGSEVVVSIADGEILAGSIPAGKMKLLQAWMEIHREELKTDWQLAVSGAHPNKIEPLR